MHLLSARSQSATALKEVKNKVLVMYKQLEKYMYCVVLLMHDK